MHGEIDNPMTDERFAPKPKTTPEIPARKMHVLIEIDAPNVEDMAGQDIAEIEAAMEQRTTNYRVRNWVACNCFDIISVAAVEVVNRNERR